MRSKIQIYYHKPHRPFSSFDETFEYVGELEVEGSNIEEVLDRVFTAMQNIDENIRFSTVPSEGVVSMLVAYKLQMGRLPRSMSVGDIAVVDGEAYYCDDVGWKRLGEPRGDADL